MNDPMGTAEHISKTPEEISAGLRAEWDPYALPALPKVAWDDPDREQILAEPRRRAIIAGLRILATWLEDHPNVPTPDAVRASYSMPLGETTRSQRLEHIQQVADELGLEPIVHDSQAYVIRRFGGYPAYLEYCAGVSLPAATAAEVVSAALEG